VVEALNRITALSEAESELFRAALNILFTESFLVRSIEHHARSYRFVVSQIELFEAYLAFAGWGIRRDETLGVIAFQGPPSARLPLAKDESIMLLILRLLYEEKAGEIALHGERTVRQQDIQDRYRVLADGSWRKTRYTIMLRRFQSLRLIRIVGPEDDPESTIVLYPSLAFALDGVALGRISERIAAYAGSAPEQSPDLDADDEPKED